MGGQWDIESPAFRSFERLFGRFWQGFGTTGVDVLADIGLACVFVVLLKWRSLRAVVAVADALFTMLTAFSFAATCELER